MNLDPTYRSSDAVDRLLAAASAPARPAELAGEEAAMIAFRAARLQGPTPAAPIRQRRRWAASAGLRIAAVVAVVTIGGGVAIAAGTGILPTPIIHTSTSAPASEPGSSTGPGASGSDATTRPGAATGATVSPEPSASADGNALRGHCQAYESHTKNGKDPSKFMDGHVYAALVAAAGGEELVPAFCQAVLEQAANGDATVPSSGEANHPEKPKKTDKP